MRDQLACLAYLLILFSCADSRSYSDVLKSTKVSDLTRTEAIRLCEETKEDSAEFDVGLCTLFAIDSDYEKEQTLTILFLSFMSCRSSSRIARITP